MLLEGAQAIFSPVECIPEINYEPLDAYLRQKQYNIFLMQKFKSNPELKKLTEEELGEKVKD